VSLSAALQARPAISRRAMDAVGQDYERLVGALDFVVVMAYAKEHGEALPWISRVAFAARTKTGARPLLAGIEAYQHPERWSYSPQEFGDALREASRGADGIVLFQYLYLFRRGTAGWNMPEGSEALLGLVPVGARGNARPAVLGVALALLTSVIGVGAYLFGRPPRPDDRGPAFGDRRASAIDWHEAETQIATGSVPGTLAMEMAAFLRELGPQRIDRWRHAAVLEAVDGCPDVERALDHLEVVPGWRMLARRYLGDALAQGHLAATNGVLGLTASGRREVLAAKGTGYDVELWRFVEKRLHETVVITCPLCRTANHGHWFWSSLECDRCRHRVSLQDGARLTILPPAVALSTCEAAWR
jgi:hypothetical protein